MATSARRSNAALVSPWAGARAIPMLAPTGIVCPFDPAPLKAEHVELPVRRLDLGCVLLAARAIRIPATVGGVLERAEFDVEEVRVTSLDGSHTDVGSMVYNLLLDGDHTYIANGFVVHNKGGSH